MNNAKHSSKNIQFFTPPAVISVSRLVLGGEIDLDPASCADANAIVCANLFFTVHDDGLAQKWAAKKVILNPPGGMHKELRKSNQEIWLKTMFDKWYSDEFESGIFIAFQLSPFRLVQGCNSDGKYKILDRLPFCIPSKRMYFWLPSDDPSLVEKFERKAGKIGGDPVNMLKCFLEKQVGEGKSISLPDGRLLVESEDPTHDNAVIGFPPKGNISHWNGFVRRFSLLFGEMGDCSEPLPLRFSYKQFQNFEQKCLYL